MLLELILKVFRKITLFYFGNFPVSKLYFLIDHRKIIIAQIPGEVKAYMTKLPGGL
jgi:hypothetical protein